MNNTYKKNGPSKPTWSRGGGGGVVRTNRTAPPRLRACSCLL